MTKKEIYSEWTKLSGNADLPIFMQSWWLDAVCAGKEWDVMLYPADADSADKVVAAMPYLIRKRLGVKFVIMPQMTQIGGMTELRSEGVKELMSEGVKEIAADFAAQLDNMGLAYYYQQYPRGSAFPEEMAQLGFKVRKRITYRIEDLSNLDKVIDAFSKNKKRQLQKALSLHGERGKMNAEQFYAFHTHCLLERRKQISYSREFLLVLEKKTQRLGCSEIVSIHNADGEVYAAAFVVWDKHSMYYLIPCYSETYKDSGAGALLVLECIKLAREKGVMFDFEGSMISGVAKHYKQFGAVGHEYCSVEKYYKWWFRLATAWNWLRLRKYN